MKIDINGLIADFSFFDIHALVIDAIFSPRRKRTDGIRPFHLNMQIMPKFLKNTFQMNPAFEKFVPSSDSCRCMCLFI